MPELPEVETVGRGLALRLVGGTVENLWQGAKKLRTPIPPQLDQLLVGAQLIAVERRAKYLLLRFSNEQTLLIHLGMSGRMTIKDTPIIERAKHDHLCLTFTDGQNVTFNDARRFGVIDVLKSEDTSKHPFLCHLGVEPLEDAFNAKDLHSQLTRKSSAIKIAIMDQALVVGVGNIYASESLFRANISPLRSANSLSLTECKALVKSIKQVLSEAIAAGGSSLRDYVQSDGELGYFQHNFRVYDRAGQKCQGCTCKKGQIERIVQAGRSTFYCPHKQK